MTDNAAEFVADSLDPEDLEGPEPAADTQFPRPAS